MTTKQATTMTDRLRQAIAESGLPMLTIATETGVQRASLIRFARGDQSLMLDAADKLAAYFGLELQPREQQTKKQSARRQSPSCIETV